MILTVFFALGALRIARTGVLTRYSPVIETLGSINILCVDKTGTLTLNKMQVCALADLNQVIVLEDKQLGLSVEVAFGDKELRSVKIIEPYAIFLTYEDGSSEKKKFLE